MYVSGILTINEPFSLFKKKTDIDIFFILETDIDLPKLDKRLTTDRLFHVFALIGKAHFTKGHSLHGLQESYFLEESYFFSGGDRERLRERTILWFYGK